MLLHSNENERTIVTINSISESLKYNCKQNKPYKSIYLLSHLYEVHKQAKLIYNLGSTLE